MVPPILYVVLLMTPVGLAGAADGDDAGPPSCYSGGSVTGAVVGTVLAIFLLQAAAYFVWNMYWKGKSGQHLVLVTDPEKGESIFAFDNPGFKEGPTILQNDEKTNQNLKVKWTQMNATSPKSKGKSLDDTYVSSPPLTRVPLKSHDFTGLGFNICGNMRDGIFVKDLLHRGPASESKRIMPGDRIDSIKINFRHMVFEDALTILSYASPYEVEMAIENRNAGNTSTLLRTPPPPHKISHPIFRSQSISDIQKISKSDSRRIGDPSSSIISEMNTSEIKYTTLDRKPKAIDPEKTQNSRNCIIENVQKHENVFHEVDLSKVEVDEVDQRKDTPSPSNVKSILVKGIQNLKEKLQNSLHQEDSKEETKGGVIVNINSQNTLEKKKQQPQSSEGYETVDLYVPNVPIEVENAGISARNRRSTIEDEIDLSDGEDPVAAKRNKRKAPKPPPTEEDEEESINHHSLQSVDSDSENGDKRSGTTIELNSSHITVHHVPESENRKASSLGDLSRFEAENITLLERAVSLDLADGAPGKKRKAPMPPQENCTFKEARLESGGTGTLKKSSVWGTLEDVIQNGSDSSDADLGISGCSTPEKSELISSTPYKFTNSILDHENDVSNVEISNYRWEMSIPESDFITALNGDETPPELPTSPMPIMSTFITEIQVASINPSNENEVIHLDNTQQLFEHINSHKLELESLNDEESTISPESPKSSPEPMIVDEIKKEIPRINHEIIKVNHDISGEMKKIGMDLDNDKHSLDFEINVVQNENGVNHEDDEFLKAERLSSNHIQEKEVESRSQQNEKKVELEGDSKKGEPSTENNKSQKSSPVQRTEIVKPSRSGITVNVKTSPSRIPVRAGPRSPSSGTSRTVIQRNGHTSP